MDRRVSVAAPVARAVEHAGDGELMQRIAEADQAAFAALYRRYQRSSISLALRICGERALGEDAVQEAFLAIWRRAHLYDRSRGEVRPWISTIVHHAAVDALSRKGDGGAASIEVEIDCGFDAEAVADAERDLETALRERDVELRRALQELPGEQSSVIELAYFGGYSLVEIAAMSCTPLGTVKSRMRLGIEKLRERLVAQQPAV